MYSHTFPQVQSARGLTFSTVFLEGRRCSSALRRFLRVGDCSRRIPVNHKSNDLSALKSGSTLRNWQHLVGSLRYRMPNSDSCSATVFSGVTLTKLRFHSRVSRSRNSYVSAK